MADALTKRQLELMQDVVMMLSEEIDILRGKIASWQADESPLSFIRWKNELEQRRDDLQQILDEHFDKPRAHA